MSYSNYCGGAPTTRRPKAIGGSECRFTNRCLQHRTADEGNEQGSEIAGAYHKLGGAASDDIQVLWSGFPNSFLFFSFFFLLPFHVFLCLGRVQDLFCAYTLVWAHSGFSGLTFGRGALGRIR